METKTKNIKPILGTGKKKTNVHLIVGNHFSEKNLDYLSAESLDERSHWIRQLMDMAKLALDKGASLGEVCKLLKYHQDGDMKKTNSEWVPQSCGLSDLIGRYLENRFIKGPIINGMLADRINPARATDKDGIQYINWTVEDLRKRAKKWVNGEKKDKS